MKKGGTKKLGDKGEQLAENYLLAQGYRLVMRNYYNLRGYHLGEIDLIVENKAGELVFVEVKTRSGSEEDFLPQDNLTATKIKKLYRIIDYYLREYDCRERKWRLDAILVNFNFSTQKATLKQLKYLRL